jgi:hypothetical protein
MGREVEVWLGHENHQKREKLRSKTGDINATGPRFPDFIRYFYKMQ